MKETLVSIHLAIFGKNVKKTDDKRTDSKWRLAKNVSIFTLYYYLTILMHVILSTDN